MEYSQEHRARLMKSNDCYMVGILAEGESYYPPLGDEQEAITTLKNSNSLIFYIKPLSVDPQPITEIIDPNLSNPLYIGIDNDQNNVVKPMTYKFTQDVREKKRILYEKLKGKLILFKPKITFSREDKTYKNLIIINIEPDVKIDKNMEFIPIPVVDMRNSEFQQKLLDGSSIILEDFNHAMYPPEYIICNNYLYFNFPEWTKHSSDSKAWMCEKYSDKVNRLKIDTSNSEIRGGDNIIFIDKQLLYKMENEGKVEKISDSIEELQYTESKLDENIYDDTNNSISNGEFEFIETFKETTILNNLCYSIEDLINLHICVKTNPLTILAGMSGTGKSELANSYAKMLKASEKDGTLLFLPISPSYTEPGDILGFLNNTTGLYIPSETRLVDFLIHAQNNSNLMHLVIFDEMNLSQVEHWFAPFISLLEQRPEERRLYLYSPEAHCINRKAYPGYIIINDNVKFIGTVNIDETTKDFSDRLLDRANIINLKKEKLAKLQVEMSELGLKSLAYGNFECDNVAKYQSWTANNNWIEAYSHEEIEFLDELHNLLNKYDVQKGVSFRIARKIGEYLLNIPSDTIGNKLLSKDVAFDIQIKQRLITKIKGTEKQYGKLIGLIKERDNNIPLNSELFNFFDSDKASKISSFTLTKNEIIRKAKELGVYGYAN
ncbi:McrB family protein [Alloiococcus sp. CFN-8]|uniref:McrB family protein n=1 Tax=Alloiococcus sp. CFN-8 TaxID=3416081 RepID=UPI003CF7C862